MSKKGSPSHVNVTLDRINYLLQAAHQCMTTNPQNLSLCRFYIYNLKSIANKNRCKLHNDIKRRICKRCFVLLYPGITACVRIKKKPYKRTVVRCLDCGTQKNYLSNRDHQLWSTLPQALQDNAGKDKMENHDTSQENKT